jgi:hypothetical protein
MGAGNVFVVAAVEAIGDSDVTVVAFGGQPLRSAAERSRAGTVVVVPLPGERRRG